MQWGLLCSPTKSLNVEIFVVFEKTPMIYNSYSYHTMAIIGFECPKVRLNNWLLMKNGEWLSHFFVLKETNFKIEKAIIWVVKHLVKSRLSNYCFRDYLL